MKCIAALFSFAWLAIGAFCQTATPNLGLTLPPYAQTNWNIPVNSNFSLIDAAIGRLQVPFQGAWSNTAVYKRGDQVSYLGSQYVSLINSNFNNLPTNASAWKVVPSSGGSFTAGGDLSGSSTSQTVTGVQGHAVPAPTSAGYFHWNGSTYVWDTPSGSGSSIAYDPVSYIAYGDSITSQSYCNSLGVNQNCYPNRLSAALNIATLTDYAISGDQACDIAPLQTLINDVPTLTAQQPLRTLMIGTNDANHKGAGSYESTFNVCYQGVLSYLTVPSASKITGGAVYSSGSHTGTCSSDTTYSDATGINCTSSGATATFTITTSGGPLYIWPRVIDGDAGTWTYAIDGGSAVAETTALTPAISTQNGGSSSMGFIRIAGLSAGSHTIVFDKTSSGGNMAILAVGTPSNVSQTASLPYLLAATIPDQLNGNLQSATDAYNSDIAADIALLKGDGLNIFTAPVNSYVQATTAAADMTNTLHPNAAGHGEIAAAFQAAAALKGGSPTIPGAYIAAGSVPTSALNSPSITVNSQPCTLGSSCTISGLASQGNGIAASTASGVSLASTIYIPLMSGSFASSTESDAQIAAPAATSLSSLFVNLTAAPGLGNAVAFTVRDSAADTTLTCTISGAATSCSDLTDTINIAKGDLLDLSAVPTGTVSATPNVKISLQWPSSNSQLAYYYAVEDAPPSSPSTMNDEFTATSLDPKWTLVNSGTPILTLFGSQYLQFTQPTQSASYNSSLLVQPAPATPYEVEVKFSERFPAQQYNWAGLVVRDSSTGKLVSFSCTDASQQNVYYYSSPSSYSSTPWTGSSLGCGLWAYMRLKDDGTNFTFSYSIDGSNWIVATTLSRTAWLANPDTVGITVGNKNVTYAGTTVFDYFRRDQ